jgi:uncharacterized protein (TIGR03083 family)
MESSPTPWISALRNSHDRLAALAGPMDTAQLQQRSYDSEWSIAQVLSHLGSQAEIFGLFLDAGLAGQEPPGREVFPPIWEAWNAKGPQEQAADALRADATVTRRFESLSPAERGSLRLKLFGMDLDTAGLAAMRLAEHAVHTWDIAVALDPAATVAPDAAGLLIDRLGMLAPRAGKADGQQRRLHVATSAPPRRFVLSTGDAVSVEPGDGEGPADLALPSEAFVRLVYGRLDPAHTPSVEAGQAILGELRQIFRGF